MIDDEGAEDGLAASVKPRPPVIREAWEERVAREAFEVISEAPVVRLALEQLLDRTAHLLGVHSDL
jgi:hypothetical protein